MRIKKFDSYNINESSIPNVDNLVISDSMGLLMRDLKTFVTNEISRCNDDIHIESEEGADETYNFDVSYNVISEEEYILSVERFIKNRAEKYNLSKIDILSRGLYLYFTYGEDTYSIPLILTMSAGGMIYSGHDDHKIKYGVWLNTNVIKKI